MAQDLYFWIVDDMLFNANEIAPSSEDQAESEDTDIALHLDANGPMQQYFHRSIGRTFPQFSWSAFGHQPWPIWRDIQYNEPKLVFSKSESYSNYFEPSTHLSDEWILNALEFLRKSVKWSKRDQNHDVCWYVEEGCFCDYEYDEKDPQPYNHMPPWLLDFRSAMCEQLNIDKENPPNSCNMNWYFNGFAGIGKHADDEELFEGKTKAIKIISVSLGAEREFEIYEEVKTEIENSKSSEKTNDGNEIKDVENDKNEKIESVGDETEDSNLSKNTMLNANAATFSMESNGSKYVNDSELSTSSDKEEFDPSKIKDEDEETSEEEQKKEYNLLKSMVLKNMSYLTMEGMFQKEFVHKVPRYCGDAINLEMIDMDNMEEQMRALSVDIGPRINITWRWITKHNDNCPLSDGDTVDLD